MSLVGTRPILQDELLKYELHHRARIAIKPGIYAVIISTALDSYATRYIAMEYHKRDFASHVKLQSPNFEVQLKVRENVNYYEPCSTIAMAVEAEIPTFIHILYILAAEISPVQNESDLLITISGCFIQHELKLGDIIQTSWIFFIK